MPKQAEEKPSWRTDLAKLDATEAIAAKATAAASYARRHAGFVEWLATQSPKIQELAAELFAIQERTGLRVGFNIRKPYVDGLGRTVYTVHFSHAYHESLESYEDALEQMVEAWRTRVEDLPETHARIQAIRDYAKPREAAREVLAIAQKVRNENPTATGEERDALVLAEIERLETEHAATPGETRPTRVPG